MELVKHVASFRPPMYLAAEVTGRRLGVLQEAINDGILLETGIQCMCKKKQKISGSNRCSNYLQFFAG
jgi:hypothetical protein